MDMRTWLRAEWDRVTGWTLVLAGVVAVIVAGLRVADTAYLADQLSYMMTGGLGGIAAILLGAGLLITAERHDEWRKLDAVEARLAEFSSGPIGVDPARSSFDDRPSDGDQGPGGDPAPRQDRLELSQGHRR